MNLRQALPRCRSGPLASRRLPLDGRSIGPKQHLAAARMRAVEEGLLVIRAANTGISAVIGARGRLVAHLGLEETGAIDADLPSPLPPTLYAQFGDFLVLPLIAIPWAVTAMLSIAFKKPEA